ncbi:MAG: ATP-binding protein, partial [Rhodospirillales bacterium]
MTLRTQLLLLVLLAALIPTLVVGVRFLAEREKGIDAAVQRLSATADTIAAALNQRIQGTAQLHYGLAYAQNLETPDRDGCSAYLGRVREAHPQYTGILTINPDGRLFCDSLATGRALDLRDRRYFRRALAGETGVVLEPAFGRLTGIAVLQIAYPVREPSGGLRYVLLASLNLEKFVHEHAVPGVEILLVADDGTVLSWLPDDTRGRYRGEAIDKQPVFAFARSRRNGGAGEVDGIDGVRQVWAASGSPALRAAGLHVLVGQSRRDLVAETDRRLIEEMVTMLGFVFILIVGILLLAEIGIRRPVGQIGRMAQRLGAGDLTARIPPPHPRGELGGLMTVLNATANSIERQQASIEELNQRLRQSQKMEAVGQLTGGVAHDFNNLLTVILGNAESLADRLAADEELRKPAEMIVTAAERGAELTRSLLAFARRQALDPRSIDVNQLVIAMEGLLRRALGEHVECRFAMAAGVRTALVDPAQLETAILNLAINARDAMPNGGRLTIETGDANLDAAYAAQNEDVTPGRYVMIAVADSGTGMPPDVAARAFEPFFTTKDVGKGTGLGLSMVYGFVKQTGGHIKLYSELGHGTIVKLYLPSTDAAPAAASPTSPAAASGAGATILAVEDEDLV